jgi:DNA-binding PadR family transcriptional regulator
MASDFQRITPQLLDVLEALLDAPDHEVHGWALMKAMGVDGPAVYRNLQRCEAAGLVSSRWGDSPEPGKPRRRLYQLSPEGEERARALIAERRRAPTPDQV